MKSHRNIKILTWFNFFTDFQPYAPVLILYFAQITGSYAAALGFYSIMTISSALAEIPTGLYSDRVGRRKTMIISAIFITLAFVLFALGHVWSLVLGLVLGGIGDAFYYGNNDALLHDTLSENNQVEEYSHHLGKVTAVFQLALGISAILGGLIANWSFEVLMWISVIPQIVCIFLAYQFVEPRVHLTTDRRSIISDFTVSLKELWRNERLRLLNFTALLENAVGESSYRFQAAFYVTLLPVWAIGFIRALANGLAFLGFHFSGTVIKRVGPLKSAFASHIVSRIISLFAYGVPSIISPFLIALTSLPFGIGSVAKNTLYQKEFKPELRATMASFNSVIGSILFAIVTYLMGLAADQYTPSKAVFLFQLFLVPTALAYLAIRIKNRRSSSNHSVTTA